MSNANAKPSRKIAIQVPGEQPAAAPAQPAAAEQQQPAAAAPSSEAAKPEVTAPAAAAPAVDLEALRARIREEERANARRELGQQIEAAASVVSQPAASTQRSKGEYQAMRAADIDPATLTAPVLTRDGYLCPLPPEPKK